MPVVIRWSRRSAAWTVRPEVLGNIGVFTILIASVDSVLEAALMILAARALTPPEPATFGHFLVESVLAVVFRLLGKTSWTDVLGSVCSYSWVG